MSAEAIPNADTFTDGNIPNQYVGPITRKPPTLVCAFYTFGGIHLGEIKLREWPDPDPVLGDIKRIAFICDECAILHWANTIESPPSTFMVQ